MTAKYDNFIDQVQNFGAQYILPRAITKFKFLAILSLFLLQGNFQWPRAKCVSGNPA